jgi:AcrR family transcriptional regulator
MTTRIPAEERRAQILAAALDLFSERGYEATSTRLIAQKVGVSEGLVFQHFPSKPDLLTGVLATKSLSALGDSLGDAPATVTLADAITRTHAFLRANDAAAWLIFREAPTNEAARSVYEQHLESVFCVAVQPLLDGDAERCRDLLGLVILDALVQPRLGRAATETSDAVGKRLAALFQKPAPVPSTGPTASAPTGGASSRPAQRREEPIRKRWTPPRPKPWVWNAGAHRLSWWMTPIAE